MQQIDELLHRLQPARLNPAEQTVVLGPRETSVQLRHDSEPWLTIDVDLSDGWGNFYGVMGHDEAYGDEWESDTIDILADLLEADYTVDTYTLRGRPWREVTTIGRPYSQTSVRTQSLSSVLPLRRWAQHIDTRRAGFECRGGRTSA